VSASYCTLLAVVSVSLSVYSTHLVLEFFEDWGRDLGEKWIVEKDITTPLHLAVCEGRGRRRLPSSVRSKAPVENGSGWNLQTSK